MSSNTIYTRIEYFYLIRHIPSGRFYAGSKYAKNAYCNPDAFWNKDHPKGYFTSSKTVRQLIEEGGIDSFEVLEVIPRPLNDAVIYETNFLKSVNASKSDRWINETNGDGRFVCYGHTIESREKMSVSKKGSPSPNKGKLMSDEQKLKQSNSMKGRTPPNKGKLRSLESKLKQSSMMKGRPTHMNDKPRSEDHKTKISKALKGMVRSEESRAKQSASSKGVRDQIVTCPHCFKTGGNSGMKRYHFINCKLASN